MKTVSVASQLLAGSDNLNRMGLAIHRTCKTLVGIMNGSSQGTQEIVINNEDMAMWVWRVRRTDQTWVILFLHQDRIFYDSRSSSVPMSMGFVTACYRRLDQLIEGVCKVQPLVMARIDSLIKLADES